MRLAPSEICMELIVEHVGHAFGSLQVLDDISFAAPDKSGETVKIDGAYVRGNIGDLAKNADLSRFIL